jgi:hypothetical protein
MPLVAALCGIAAGLELSLGVLLEPCVFLLESTLNAFSAFLLTDSSGSFAPQLSCAVEFGTDFPGEICRLQQRKSTDSD